MERKNEYIDRQAALDALCDGTFEDAEMSIRSIPAADVAPVVHGRWISYADGLIICTACNGRLFMSKTQFCPLCGARMDEKL